MQLLHASWLHSKGIQHRSLATVWGWQWFCDAAHFKMALYQFRQSRMTLSRVKLRRVAHIGTPGWHTGAAAHFLYCNFCSTTGNDEFPSKLRMDSPRSVQSGNPTLHKKVPPPPAFCLRAVTECEVAWTESLSVLPRDGCGKSWCKMCKMDQDGLAKWHQGRT